MKFYITLILLVITLNFCLITKYRTENIDESWYLSFYDNYINHSQETDITFLAENGQDGVQYFGKTTAFFYAPVLNTLGWTRHNAEYVSFLLVGLAVTTWYKIIKLINKNKDKRWFSDKFALTAVILMLILECYVQMINSARNEPILFLFGALFFLTFIKKKYFISAFLYFVAVEIQPLGILSLIPILLYWYTYKIKITKKELLLLTLGILTGLFYYICLHFAVLTSLIPFLQANSITGWKNLFIQYFIYSNFYRHIFDLSIFLASFIYFCKKLYKKKDLNIFIILYTSISFVILLVFPRPNINYTGLILIGPVLMLSYTLANVRFGKILLLFIIFVISFQYIYLIYKNYSTDYDKQIYEVREMVPTDNLPIIGSTNEWFAFRNRQFYPSSISDRFPNNIKTFYLIAENDFRNPPKGITHEKLIKFLAKCSNTLLKGQIINKELFEAFKYNCE